MAHNVNLVHVRDKQKRLRGALRSLMPDLYEHVSVLLTTWRDRRYWRQQGTLFESLPEVTEKPFHIEIETLNRCNSTCGFCPVNRLVDPRPLERMDEALFRRIIDELAAWDYDRLLNLYSNNEPFLDKRLYDFTAYARAQLPRAFIQITSNGTALNAAKVERILPFLSRLIINNYSSRSALHDNVRAIVEHLQAKRPDLAPKLLVFLRQLDEFKTNRAGRAPNRPVATTTYRSRCAYPFFQMVIRPDGKISLCCHDALGEVTLGDLRQDALRSVWQSEARRQAQTAMLAGRDTMPLCAQCDNLSWAKPQRLRTALRSGSFTG
jgi:radical SAM protein with 4Fe4S-binding SPASM domain